MRQVDKLVLLAELVNVNVEEFIEEKKYSFSNDAQMKTLESLINENKTSMSPKYLIAKRDYEELKRTKINSMQEYFICNLKVIALINNLQNKEFINPLMCSSDERDILLSDLKVDFDGKDIALGDMVLIETYSDQYKIDMVKNLIIKWKKEVDDSYIRPLQLLLTYPKNLPLKRIIPLNKFFIGMFLLVMNMFVLYSFFSNNMILKDILNYKSTIYYLSLPFYVLLGLIYIFDFLFIFFLIRRNNKHEKYFYAQNSVLKKSRIILKHINKNTERLYSKILNCIVNKNELKGNIASYSIKEKDILALNYLKEENEVHDLVDDHVSNYEIVLIELIVILFIYIITVFLMLKFEVIK